MVEGVKGIPCGIIDSLSTLREIRPLESTSVVRDTRMESARQIVEASKLKAAPERRIMDPRNGLRDRLSQDYI